MPTRDTPAWARDPETLETLFRETLRAGDIKGLGFVLHLMAVVDPARAQEMLDTLELGVKAAVQLIPLGLGAADMR